MNDLTVPDVGPDDDALAAALKYASAGWYVVPIKRGTKHPGSVLGKRWEAQSSRDPQQIAAWFAGESHGVALHAGRSGAVIFDVDDPDQVPDVLGHAFGRTPPPMQTTREGDTRRGHYLYRQPAGRMVGNGTGDLGKTWGEVRGRNGVIIVAPSHHPKAADGGRYAWQQAGTLPPLPDEVAQLLPDAATTAAGAVTDDEVRGFLTARQGNARPMLLRAVLGRLEHEITAGGSRHNATLDAACWAMREAHAGFYPANQAAAAIGERFTNALRGERDAGAEYAGILSFAIAQAQTSDVDALRAAVAQRAPDRQLTDLIAPPPDDDGPALLAPPPDQEPPPVDDDPQRPSFELLQFRTIAQLRADVAARGPRRWLLRGIWPAGDYGIHAAEKKAQKTWNTVDLAVAVASGTPWLGFVPVDTQGPVLMFVGEGGEGNTLRRIDAAAAEHSVDADTLPIHICTRAPHLNNAEHMAVFAYRVQQLQPALVTLDPLYLAARGAELGDLYKMGALLEGPQHICQDANASLFVVTHFNRQQGKGASRITGAGPAEWGRVLISASVKARHTDPETRATRVLTELEIIGGEIPDQVMRINRRIWSDDPDDIDSPIHTDTTASWGETDTDDAAGFTDQPGKTDLPPAARKLLEAIDAADQPRSSAQLVDWIAEHHGHGLRRETVSRTLNELEADGIVEHLELTGSGGRWPTKLWSRTPPCDPRDITRDPHTATDRVTPRDRALNGHGVTSHGHGHTDDDTPQHHTVNDDLDPCPECSRITGHRNNCSHLSEAS